MKSFKLQFYNIFLSRPSRASFSRPREVDPEAELVAEADWSGGRAGCLRTNARPAREASSCYNTQHRGPCSAPPLQALRHCRGSNRGEAQWPQLRREDRQWSRAFAQPAFLATVLPDLMLTFIFLLLFTPGEQLQRRPRLKTKPQMTKPRMMELWKSASLTAALPGTWRNRLSARRKSAPTCSSASPFWQRQGIPATWDSLKPFSSHAVHQCFVLTKNLSVV